MVELPLGHHVSFLQLQLAGITNQEGRERLFFPAALISKMCSTKCSVVWETATIVNNSMWDAWEHSLRQHSYLEKSSGYFSKLESPTPSLMQRSLDWNTLTHYCMGEGLDGVEII